MYKKAKSDESLRVPSNSDKCAVAEDASSGATDNLHSHIPQGIYPIQEWENNLKGNKCVHTIQEWSSGEDSQTYMQLGQVVDKTELTSFLRIPNFFRDFCSGKH